MKGKKMTVSILFGSNLKRIIKEKGFTQDEFRKTCGIGRRTLRDLLSGSHFPSEATLKKICTVLEVDEKCFILQDGGEENLNKKARGKGSVSILDVLVVNLETYLKKNRMDLPELSTRSGISLRTLSLLQAKRTYPVKCTFTKLAEAFKIDELEMVRIPKGLKAETVRGKKEELIKPRKEKPAGKTVKAGGAKKTPAKKNGNTEWVTSAKPVNYGKKANEKARPSAGTKKNIRLSYAKSRTAAKAKDIKKNN